MSGLVLNGGLVEIVCLMSVFRSLLLCSCKGEIGCYLYECSNSCLLKFRAVVGVCPFESEGY